ncbi:MAG TPA: hypothetical protein VLG47_03615 [Candidatus Saccharimonadales bacterium]|nr:hypothetical protein [Candidatus Saccharimonadales bacterium]
MSSGEQFEASRQLGSVQLRTMALLLGPEIVTNPYTGIAFDQLTAAANSEADYERSKTYNPDMPSFAGDAAYALGYYAINTDNVHLADFLYLRASPTGKWRLYEIANTDPDQFGIVAGWHEPKIDEKADDKTKYNYQIARLIALSKIAIFNFAHTPELTRRDSYLSHARWHRDELIKITQSPTNPDAAPFDVDYAFAHAGILDVLPRKGASYEFHEPGYCLKAAAGRLSVRDRLSLHFAGIDGKFLRWMDKCRKNNEINSSFSPEDWRQMNILGLVVDAAPDLLYYAKVELPLPQAHQVNLSMGDFANAVELYRNFSKPECSNREILKATLDMAQYYRSYIEVRPDSDR